MTGKGKVWEKLLPSLSYLLNYPLNKSLGNLTLFLIFQGPVFQGLNIYIYIYVYLYTVRIFPPENGDIPTSYVSLPEGVFFLVAQV